MPAEHPVSGEPIRVLHLISSSGLYGAEKMAVTLCVRLMDLGVQPVLEVFHNRHAPNLEVADHARAAGVPVRVLDCGGRFDPRAVGQLVGDLRETRADLVHTHGYKPHLYGYLAARRVGAAAVATVHRFDQGRNNALDGPLLRRFDAVLAVSREAEHSVNSVYRINPRRTLTIPNGIDPTPFLTATRRPPTPVGSLTVGMVARLSPEKAPDDLLAAARIVLDTDPGTRFLFVGGGPLLDHLQTQAQSLGIAEQVKFLGFRNDVAAVYESLDILVQPSYREGMPMTLLEAMASGLPVIASEVGAASDMIEDARTGTIVPAGNVPALAAALRRLLGDGALRQRMGENARAEVSTRFTDRVMAQTYLAAYRDVLRFQAS